MPVLTFIPLRSKATSDSEDSDDMDDTDDWIRTDLNPPESIGAIQAARRASLNMCPVSGCTHPSATPAEIEAHLTTTHKRVDVLRYLKRHVAVYGRMPSRPY